MLSSLSLLAEIRDYFAPGNWMYLQLAGLVLAIVIIVFYVRWKKKQT